MRNKTVLLFFMIATIGYGCFAQTNPSGNIEQIVKQDLTAENMLLWQRSYGGWPKDTYTSFFDDTKPTKKGNNPKKVLIDYGKEQTTEQKQLARDTKDFIDATIDNDHTVKEIRYLLGAFRNTGNTKYKEGAERGISYLLKAQYANGGWPQFFPDTRGYKNDITYNDNAMTNVMKLMYDVSHKINNVGAIDNKYIDKADAAFNKGINVILKTQVMVNGKRTVWCAQHDGVTLKPVKARSYELPSLSGSESVGVVQVLMLVDQPSEEIKLAIINAINWFEEVKIVGYKTERIKDASQPKGEDVILVPLSGGVLWARFYDLDTNKPFFCDRDGIKKNTLAEIGNERRTGYSWYGDWPYKLINVEYPAWKKKYVK